MTDTKALRELLAAAEAEQSLDDSLPPDEECSTTARVTASLAFAGAMPSLLDELDRLRAEVEARHLLVHTVECWDYAAFTIARSGVHHCIVACSRLRRGEITAEQYREEMRKR